jgi:arylsulfatase A-like enzyme
MNVIVLMNDTLRRDHINAYGVPAPWTRPGHDGEPFIHTPHLDQLATQSALFDRFYCGSYPTIPCRYDLFTGRYGFPHRGWQPLEPADVILSEIVADHGYLSMLIFDTPPLAGDDYNYTRGFEGWDWLRGQHADRYRTNPAEVSLPAAPRKVKTYPAMYRFLRNSLNRRYERDWMCGKTVTAAMDWLEDNRTRDGFVLWVDMWDPHEPFDAPAYDEARYVDPNYSGGRLLIPRYGRPDYMTTAERDHVRALYAAQVTLVDRWIGRLLEKVETLGLDKNTLIIYLTDHGHLFGDHDLQGKPTGPLGMLYEATARVPLLIRHPEGMGVGQRIEGLAQHPDILPTILDFLGVPIPSSVQGASLLPLMAGTTTRVREAAFSGRYSRVAGLPLALARQETAHGFDGSAGLERFGEPFTVSTEEWSFICPPGNRPRELYHLRQDPRQTQNVIAQHPAVAADLHRQLLAWLESMETSPERIRAYGDDALAQPGLPAETPLFTITDQAGQIYAFLDEHHAQEAREPDLTGQKIEQVTLADLRDTSPRALVYIHEQYYWAQELD